jgi:hypothetical protein
MCFWETDRQRFYSTTLSADKITATVVTEWNMNNVMAETQWQGKAEELSEIQSVPVPLCRPQIPLWYGMNNTYTNVSPSWLNLCVAHYVEFICCTSASWLCWCQWVRLRIQTPETSVHAHTEIEMFQRQMAYNMVVNTAMRATDKLIPGKAYWDFSNNQRLRLRGHLHVPHALNQWRSLRILTIAQTPTGAPPALLYRNRTPMSGRLVKKTLWLVHI